MNLSHKDWSARKYELNRLLWRWLLCLVASFKMLISAINVSLQQAVSLKYIEQQTDNTSYRGPVLINFQIHRLGGTPHIIYPDSEFPNLDDHKP